MRTGTSSSAGQHPSSSAISPSGSSSTRSTNTSAGLEPHSLDALDDGTRDTLAEILPSLNPPAGSRATAVLHDRYRVHAAVRDLLERLAAVTPLVLLVDDLHWADTASIELFGALLRRPPDAPILVAASLRPRQAPGRLSAALERAHRSGVLQRIEIGALTQPRGS